MSEQSCLNCRWLDEPDQPYPWHKCLWPEANLPPAVLIEADLVSIEDPYTRCPTWELRTEQEP